MTHDEALRRAGLGTVDSLTVNILETWDRATDTDKESGASWYHDAEVLASMLATERGISVEHAAAVIAHLSPRLFWSRNVVAATELLLHDKRASGILQRSYDAAVACLDAEDPMSTFSDRARKTASFAANIAGDREAVTIDVWAARVAGVTQQDLYRRGVYDAVAEAYRQAARLRGVDPVTMQATTWIVARNGRAT